MYHFRFSLTGSSRYCIKRSFSIIDISFGNVEQSFVKIFMGRLAVTDSLSLILDGIPLWTAGFSLSVPGLECGLSVSPIALPRLGITEVSKALGLPKPTVHGLVRTLVKQGSLSAGPANPEVSGLGLKIYELADCSRGLSWRSTRKGAGPAYRACQNKQDWFHEIAIWDLELRAPLTVNIEPRSHSVLRSPDLGLGSPRVLLGRLGGGPPGLSLNLRPWGLCRPGQTRASRPANTITRKKQLTRRRSKMRPGLQRDTRRTEKRMSWAWQLYRDSASSGWGGDSSLEGGPYQPVRRCEGYPQRAWKPWCRSCSRQRREISAISGSFPGVPGHGGLEAESMGTRRFPGERVSRLLK